MSEWKYLTLSAIADIRVSNVDKKSIAGEKPVLLCNYMDVYSNEYITGSIEFMEATANASEIEKFKVQLGDVVITKDSETPYDIGIPAVIEEPIDNLVCGYHLALIKPNKNVVDSKFLGKQLAMDGSARYFSKYAAGSTRYGLSNAAIANVVIGLPSLAQQQKIAQILKTIDQAIEKTEQLIEKYQQIKAGLMHDLFTRGIGADGQLRPPREQAPELYQETPIGWIPKEWKCLPLRDILSIEGGYLQTGPFGSQLHAHEYQPEGISVVMPQNIENGSISISQMSYISESRAMDLAKHRMKVGDIVISRRGDLSRSAAIQKHEIGWVCGTGCFLLRLATTQLSPEFISLCYRQSFIQRQVEGLSVGSTMPSLNNEIMGKLRFPYCSLDEQMRIVRKVSIIDLKICTHVSELEKLRSQKFGLMHDLLTGKVPVSVDPVKAPLSLEQGAA